MKKLLYLSLFLVVLGNRVSAQIDVVRQISLEKNAGQSRLFLLYEDSLYRILAPENAIDDVLKPFKESDRLPLAFRQLDNENSTDYHRMSIKRGLASESQFLIHELMERGDCLIEKKADDIKIKAVVAMSYKKGDMEGITYNIGDHVLYNYIVPKK